MDEAVSATLVGEGEVTGGTAVEDTSVRVGWGGVMGCKWLAAKEKINSVTSDQERKNNKKKEKN